ncbi:MAG: hypothetical protein ACP5RR_07165 [Candidatus Kapaibacteriota bacterium]
MKPLRICFLWHQHQPYYRKGEKFILPWVRFHAVKDYLDLPLMLDEYISMKQTFNIVPSLLLQLYEYTKESVVDRIQELSRKHPSMLSEDEKQEIAKQFFVCNFPNMVEPYPRYLELYQKVQSGTKLGEQDWMDLQVWYNLTWVGQLTRLRPQFFRYFLKGRNFTQKEKECLLDEQLKILDEIVPNLARLKHFEQVELSISPFYHPILPLLCDTAVANVGLPQIPLPEPGFKHPEDARQQIIKGKEYFEKVFGFEPRGLWPSEGSLSTEVLDIILENGFDWTATDSKLLFNTIDNSEPLLQYFPFVYEKDGRRLTVFFRDSVLSDAIGFTYQKWRIEDAVADFVNMLNIIRNKLIDKFGEDSLERACVPIILDGENCWEYYKDNGLPFLRLLYKTISENNLLQTMTFSEIVQTIPSDYSYRLNEIFPGSWINANFYTWIGQTQKQKAWIWLSKTRELIEKHKVNVELYNKAMDLILVAEGSDWFWWYGDDNIAPNKYDFDELFRWYLMKIYEILGEEIPKELQQPLGEEKPLDLLRMPSRLITENNKNILDEELGWGVYYAKSAIGTMHTNKIFVSKIYFGNTRDLFLVGLQFERQLNSNDKIWIYFTTPREFKVELGTNKMIISASKPVNTSNIYFAFDQNLILGIDLFTFFGRKENYSGSIIEFTVKTENEIGEISFPIEGAFTYIVV